MRSWAELRLAHIGERMPADRIGLVDSFFGQLGGWASRTPRWSGSGFTRLVVELADLPGHPARAIAGRAKAKTEAWLADRLARARVKNPRERSREIAQRLREVGQRREAARQVAIAGDQSRYAVRKPPQCLPRTRTGTSISRIITVTPLPMSRA